MNIAWRAARHLLAALILSVLLAACASAPVVNEPSSNEIDVQVDDLREQQMRLLYQYDVALNEGEKGCRAICRHHTQICVLSTRICNVAKKQSGHYKARAACLKATETCRETTVRIPEDCWCRE